MSVNLSLVELFESAVRANPEHVAVLDSSGHQVTYRELAELSDQLRDVLQSFGVRRGDRVGFRLRKSIDSVITIFGILKSGAAYVPVDASSPISRGAFILGNCNVKAAIVDVHAEIELASELDRLGSSAKLISVDQSLGHIPLKKALDRLRESIPRPKYGCVSVTPDDLAYILYTSGSTGQPKGVVLSHGNAMSFVNWSSEVFKPQCTDRFSSHAPFHFDLSIFDIFVTIKHGATLVLVDEELGKDPVRLAEYISQTEITVWYSTPSILSLLANYGKLQKFDYKFLRLVLFAGEVFPVPQFQRLLGFWPNARYFNLYGPTETNVCTWFEVPTVGAILNDMPTFPIGNICDPNKGMVVDASDNEVRPGMTGELLVAGPNVMQEYWNLPEQTAGSFLEDDDGTRWYRTGDLVRQDPAQRYVYLGRRDRMVKRRGYRVELGEIEVGILKHPDIQEAAAVAIPDEESGVKILAFVTCQKDTLLSIISLKTHAAKQLPPYMIPDTFHVVDELPRTSTDKIDYQALKDRSA